MLLLVHLLDVELEFLALKNVAVASARLAGTRADASQNSTTLELVGNLLVDDAVLLGAGKLGLDVSRLLGGSSQLVGLLNLLDVELDVVLTEIPESERIGVDLNNGVLDEGLGTDKLVVGGVVDNIKNLGLSSDGLRAPGEIAGINSQSSVFIVGTSTTDWANTLGSLELGHGGLSTHLELSLLLMDRHSTGGGSPLVS